MALGDNIDKVVVSNFPFYDIQSKGNGDNGLTLILLWKNIPYTVPFGHA